MSKRTWEAETRREVGARVERKRKNVRGSDGIFIVGAVDKLCVLVVGGRDALGLVLYLCKELLLALL